LISSQLIFPDRCQFDTSRIKNSASRLRIEEFSLKVRRDRHDWLDIRVIELIEGDAWIAPYINSAPIRDPRRHLTRARRPEPASRDVKRVKTPGIVSAA
jgi:hypothetical protein